MTVLVVDDQETTRKVLRIALESRDVKVHEARDGVEALALLERESVNAIISDVLMPRMDGYRLCQEIRAHPRLFALPFIFHTGTYVSPSDAAFSLRVGADRFLKKPATVDLLFAAIEDAAGAVRQPAVSNPPQQIDLTRQYSERLVAKLEEKNLELERVINELAESRARLESIIGSALDAIITIDDAHRIVLFNVAAEKMFRTPSHAVLGSSLDQLLPGGPSREQLARVGISSPGASSPPHELVGALTGRRANGEEFPIEASISKAEIGGRHLFTVILRDVSERKRAEEQLQAANEQLRALASRNESVREEERTAIAREIHDVLAQELTRLKIDLIWLAKRVAKPIDEPTQRLIVDRTNDAIAQTDVAISTVQRIATELRPVILDSLGLPAAVEWQVEDFARRTGLKATTRVPPGGTAFTRSCATALFRILQESLTNIARHARATQFEVQLIDQDDGPVLIVADNGCGISRAQLTDPKAIGIAGMRERAQALGGTIVISGRSGAGTTIEVRIPNPPVRKD